MKYVRILGGNQKAFYVTVEEKKLKQIPKTIFGKPTEGQFPAKSEFMEALEKEDKALIDTRLYQALKKIQKQSAFFYRLFPLHDF